jgi:capsular polysaccharide export protein
VHVHSDFDSSIHFIEKVMNSFAKHAPQETALVIKHHPMDRGYSDYSALIANLSRQLGLIGRCIYVHDQHLPTLLQHARGVVVINSTVGLSAMHHEKPLKVCGNAIYDIQGLTFHGSLDDFWREAQTHIPNRTLLHAFHNYLVRHTQLNGNFYKRLRETKTAAGMRWIAKRGKSISALALLIWVQNILNLIWQEISPCCLSL